MKDEAWALDEEAKSECDEAKRAGCLFYEMPWEIKWELVDPLIRNAVRRLNGSGYVWSAESCEGHPDAAVPGAWASNTSPMLRLVARKMNQGTVVYRLFEAYEAVKKAAEQAKQPFELGGYRMHPQQRGAWAETLVYVSALNVFQRNQGIQVFEKFAELVTR